MPLRTHLDRYCLQRAMAPDLISSSIHDRALRHGLRPHQRVRRLFTEHRDGNHLPLHLTDPSS